MKMNLNGMAEILSYTNIYNFFTSGS